MSEEKILEIISKAIQKVMSDKTMVITKETNFVDDLNFNSIMFFMMITTVEDEIDFYIPERLLRKMDTIGDLVEAIAEQKK